MDTPRKRAPNKTPEEVFVEAVQQVERARIISAEGLELGRGRRSLKNLPDLSNLPSVRRFSLRRAQVRDISPLSSLQNLEALQLFDVPVEDLSSLSDLKKLRVVAIMRSSVHDLSPLCHLPEMYYLSIISGRIKYIESLSSMSELRSLDLTNNPINSIEFVSDLHKLERLELSRTNVKDLSPISNLKSLRKIVLRATPITDISVLGELPNLEHIDVSSSSVYDVSPLANLHNMRQIDLSNTKVSDITALASMAHIKRIDLDYTAVKDLSPLADLMKLERLDIDNTLVSDLTPLSKNINLARSANYGGGIWCSDCPLEDPNLLSLSQKDNPDRSVEIINYLRNLEDLPQLSFGSDASDDPPEVPGQGPGPHFAISLDGIIDFAPPTSLDSLGNNINRLQALKPILEEAAQSLLNGLNRNEHPQLSEIVKSYYDELCSDIESIDFARLYGLGLRLQNAAAAAERMISERMLPELEDPIREALYSLTNLHGPFILSTAQGLELVELAERFQRKPEEEKDIREASILLGEKLEHSPEIIDPEAANFVRNTAEDIATGVYPDRTATYGLATAKNISIVLVAGATCGALPLLGGVVAGIPGGVIGGVATLIGVEGLKKTKAFKQVSGLLTDKIDSVEAVKILSAVEDKAETLRPYLRFVLNNEEILRRLAGDRIQFRWLHTYLDWLKRNSTKFDK